VASKIRERILTTAARCFARRGFCGTSTKEVADLADVTEGSLFRLFNSKDQLCAESLGLVLTKGAAKVRVRLVLFALLEGRGLTPENRKAIARLSKTTPAVKAVLPFCTDFPKGS
jgi:AcrR family transcriptional regulator